MPMVGWPMAHPSRYGRVVLARPLEYGEELLHGGGQDLVFLMDGSQRADELLVLDLDLDEGLFGDLLRNRAVRHNGDAGIDLDGAFDRFDVVEFHHVTDAHVAFLEDFIDRPAGRDVRLEADEFLSG